MSSHNEASTEPKSKRQKTGGFKWKEKRSRDDQDGREKRDEGLQRGYRDRSPRRERRREEDPHRHIDEERGHEHSRRDRERERSPRPEDRHDTSRNTRELQRDNGLSESTAEKFGLSMDKKDKKDKPKKVAKNTAPSEPMIIVNINDRLGTKAAIPCLASDSVKAFKAIVAAHIGRQPHEIMLKRQGERPFKDQLTLEDYGVSSGVQLDLEIDTGD